MYTFFYIILNGKISELPYGPYERIISYDDYKVLKLTYWLGDFTTNKLSDEIVL